MCQLIQKAEDVQKTETIKDHLSEKSSMDNHSNPITINGDVHDPKIVPGNMSYRALKQNNCLPFRPAIIKESHFVILTLILIINLSKRQENQLKIIFKKTHKIGTSQKQSTPQTLIIGDSILSGVNQKGLRNKVDCQPVSGASVD